MWLGVERQVVDERDAVCGIGGSHRMASSHSDHYDAEVPVQRGKSHEEQQCH
jgi:hypothetical protein